MAVLRLMQAFCIKMFNLFSWNRSCALTHIVIPLFLLHPFLRFCCLFMQVSNCLLFTAELGFKKVIKPFHHFFLFFFFRGNRYDTRIEKVVG